MDFNAVLRKKKIEKEFHKFVEENPVFYILDTETTGLGYDAEAVELSIIDQDGNKVIDTLIKPSIPIPEEASKVHGIYAKDVENAPTWDKIFPELKAQVTGKKVLIYNSQYDIKIIKSCNRHYGITEPVGAIGKCVMLPFAEWHGIFNPRTEDYRWVSLETAAKELNLDTSKVRLHRAIGDCQITLGVVKELARRGSQYE